jgi:hypothetical protein
MNANDLLHYLRGFFELVTDPTPAQITAIRNEILRATPVKPQPLPPMPPPPSGDCGCRGKGGHTPAPALDHSKL